MTSNVNFLVQTQLSLRSTSIRTKNNQRFTFLSRFVLPVNTLYFSFNSFTDIFSIGFSLSVISFSYFSFTVFISSSILLFLSLTVFISSSILLFYSMVCLNGFLPELLIHFLITSFFPITVGFNQQLQPFSHFQLIYCRVLIVAPFLVNEFHFIINFLHALSTEFCKATIHSHERRYMI